MDSGPHAQPGRRQVSHLNYAEGPRGRHPVMGHQRVRPRQRESLHKCTSLTSPAVGVIKSSICEGWRTDGNRGSPRKWRRASLQDGARPGRGIQLQHRSRGRPATRPHTQRKLGSPTTHSRSRRRPPPASVASWRGFHPLGSSGRSRKTPAGGRAEPGRQFAVQRVGKQRAERVRAALLAR